MDLLLDNIPNIIMEHKSAKLHVHENLSSLFYYGTEENSKSAFELFFKASESNYSLAQVYIAKCYNDGYGIEQNKYLAFKWYQKLAYCYDKGIGIEINKEMALELYKDAAEKGNKYAQYVLGSFYIKVGYHYDNGIGTQSWITT
ncbi:15382_t:CDS:2 [Funneliformis geosporum]|uniref:15382_t:CDS:1 n=1 Tax=Funneliformis geosporum TaxID=1117311 RepID=A0A9W4WPP4_9GLOM|nr:15382_t:CDS:2 [Funneliformis geosporum]